MTVTLRKTVKLNIICIIKRKKLFHWYLFMNGLKCIHDYLGHKHLEIILSGYIFDIANRWRKQSKQKYAKSEV